MKYGAPYKIQPPLNLRQKSFTVTPDSMGHLALLDLGAPVFPEGIALPLGADFRAVVGQALLICGSPKGKEPRTRTGGEVLEILDSGIFVLGVPGYSGYIGSLVTTMDG